MKTISATEAKNKFGDLMAGLSSGPIAITRNGRVAAYLTSPETEDRVLLDESQLSKALQSYSNGKITEKVLCEASGLWFADILNEMGRRGLKLPKVDTTTSYSEKQMIIYNTIFGVK